MRSGDQSSQISEEECYAGGICPSCRLAINKDTGRLKWCAGRNKFWRAWIKFMLLIPAVVLPVIIICIALSRSTVSGPFSLHQSTEKNSERRRDTATYDSPHLEHLSVEEDRVKLSDDMEVSFVPTGSFINSKYMLRNKREMDQSKRARQLRGNNR